MRKYIVVCFLIIGALVSFPLGAHESSFDVDEVNELLKPLEEALNNRSNYEANFMQRIQNLRELCQDNSNFGEVASIRFKLAQEFSFYSLDSSQFYLDKTISMARSQNNHDLLVKSEILMADLYTKSGFYLEAHELLKKYNFDELSESLKYDYSFAAYSLVGELIAYSKNMKTSMRSKEFYRDYLIEHTAENTYEWYNLMRDKMVYLKRPEEERKYAQEMVACSNPGFRQYAEATYFLAMTWMGKDVMKELEWMIRSAISDIICATKDYEALNEISRLLFQMGYIEKAFKMTADYCLPDALLFNGRLRPLQIAQFFSDIEHAYQEERDVEHQYQTVYLFILVLIVVVLIMLISLVFSRQKVLESTRNQLQESNEVIKKRNDELIETNEKLKESDKIKEEYISLFLGILSENIDTQRKYRNHVLQNIRKGNYALLEDEIKNMPSIDGDINEFYKMFDQTFINMYPDFVEKFNSLLEDGEEVYPKNDDLLSPEQRIYALIKLGITDSSKIASLLHYSKITIYNYKSKIRSKVRGDRNKFEENLLELI